METEVAAGLDWADRDYEILCRHVLEHGEQDWALIAAVLKCPVELLALKWEVLRVRAQELTGDGTVPSGRKWDNWELGMLLRGIDAFPDFKQAKLCRVLASWLPGRTKNGVKQALKKYIYPCYDDNLATPLREELPQTITGVLMRWQRQTDEEIPAQQVADYILSQASELLTTAPSSKTIGVKRKRPAVGTQKQPSVRSEEAGVGINLAAGEAQFSPLLAVGAAAVKCTLEGVWDPCGSYSPELSSSSSMVWPGISTPGSSPMLYQGAATVQQLLPSTFGLPLTICTQMPSHNDCSSLSGDGPDSSRSVTTNVAAAGFNALITQYNMSQQQRQACVVHQQQQNNLDPEQEGLPTKRQRSRLSQPTTYGMPGHAALSSQAAWSGAENILPWSTAATAGSLEPGLLMPACNSWNITGTAAVAYGKQASVFDWSSGSVLDVAQQLQAPAAAAAAVGRPPANGLRHQTWLLGSTCAAPPGQQLLQSTSSWQPDSMIQGAAVSASDEAAAAMFAAQHIPDVTSVSSIHMSPQQQPGIVASYIASDQGSATASPTAAPCHLNDLLTVMDEELQEMFGKLESSLGLARGFMDDDERMASSKTGDDMSLDDIDMLGLSPKLLDGDWWILGC